jgi:iron(III) transport system permease protein
LLSVLFAAAVGVPLAFLFELGSCPGRRLLGGLVALPVALPPLVGVVAFYLTYGESGLVVRTLQSLGLAFVRWELQGPFAILLVHVYAIYVYYYLFTRAALARLDPALLEAAAALGASRWQTVSRVTLPLLRPAFGGATCLAFLTAAGSFSAPYVFGDTFRVMTTQIFASKLNGRMEAARVETLLLCAFAVGGLLLLRRLDPGIPFAMKRGRGFAARRAPTAAWRGIGVSLLAWGLALLILLPHAVLVLMSFLGAAARGAPQALASAPRSWSAANYWTLFTDGERLRPLANSLWMASAAALAATLLGLFAARLARRSGGLAGRALEAVVLLPWAVPGTVLALALATTWSVHAASAGRFLLVGTPWLLPLAYLLRSLPLAGRSAIASVRQFDGTLEEAAVILGASRLRTLFRVVLPLLRPALVAGAALAWINGLGDFVTSVVLYTWDNRPIAVEILASLRMQESGVAAAYGVLLMLASAAALLVWERGQR